VATVDQITWFTSATMGLLPCQTWGALLLCLCCASVYGQLPSGGLGGLPLQSNLGALSGGILPQAPPASQPSGFSGLGGIPGSLGQPAQPAAGLPSTGLGGLPGAGGQGALPTLNLMGGALGQGGAPGQGSATPQHIQQMQAQAVQSPKLDTMCPGKARSATNVGQECWAIIWTSGGCKAENLPKYEDWHQMQSLEVLVGDVVQWANLPDQRHKEGCYGESGPPQNEPAPPMPTQGMGSGLPNAGGLGGLGGLGAGGLGAPGGLAAGGLGAPGGLGAGPQGPSPPPEVMQKIMSALQSPDIANLCPGVGGQATAVGEACWKKIWRHVGCLESTTPAYGEWHNSQSFEVLVADAAQWASLPSATHKRTCFGSSVEL